MKVKRVLAPQWARDIVDTEARGRQTKIYWTNMRPGYCGHGRGSPWDNWIKCYADPDKTSSSLCLVLHEITHVLVPPDGIKARQRWAWHGPEFIRKVIQLYEKYNVLEYAAKWERYKRIRNAIERYLIMNRYAKAAPSKEQENTYVMVKCDKCGFKDATNDRDNWTCPECEVSVKKVITAPIKHDLKFTTQPITPETEKILEEQNLMAAVKLNKETQEAIADSYAGRVEKVDLMSAFHKLTGIKPAEPAQVKESFKVGGLQCKIVTTNRK